MIELNIIKNKANGQIILNIPKSVADLYSLDEKAKIILEPRSKDEFLMKIKR